MRFTNDKKRVQTTNPLRIISGSEYLTIDKLRQTKFKKRLGVIE